MISQWACDNSHIHLHEMTRITGKGASLFVPSGTMVNLICLLTLVKSGVMK